jgi:hypothetical protein
MNSLNSKLQNPSQGRKRVQAQSNNPDSEDSSCISSEVEHDIQIGNNDEEEFDPVVNEHLQKNIQSIKEELEKIKMMESAIDEIYTEFVEDEDETEVPEPSDKRNLGLRIKSNEVSQ